MTGMGIKRFTTVVFTILLKKNMKILLIGSGAREHAIARALDRSLHEKEIYCLASNMNPGIAELCHELTVGNINGNRGTGKSVSHRSCRYFMGCGH